MKKPYELPSIFTIGSVHSLTQSPNKCGGSGDMSYPIPEITATLDPYSNAACPAG